MRYGPGFKAFATARWSEWISMCLSELGIQRSELAARLETVAPSRVSEWVDARRGPSAEVAYRVGGALSSAGLLWASELVALYQAGWIADVIGILAGLIDEAGSRDYCAGLFIASLPRLEALDWAIRRWPESSPYLGDNVDKESLLRARGQVREMCVLATYGDDLSASRLSRSEAHAMFASLWRGWDRKRRPNKSWPAQFVAAFELSQVRGITPRFAMRGAWEQLYGWMSAGISIGGLPLDVQSDEYEAHWRGNLIRRLIASDTRKTTQPQRH